MSRRQTWLECACGFQGYVPFLQQLPDSCPACEFENYQQLALAASPAMPRILPKDWHKLSPEQKSRVNQYIATLLAEQPRLL